MAASARPDPSAPPTAPPDFGSLARLMYAMPEVPEDDFGEVDDHPITKEYKRRDKRCTTHQVMRCYSSPVSLLGGWQPPPDALSKSGVPFKPLATAGRLSVPDLSREERDKRAQRHQRFMAQTPCGLFSRAMPLQRGFNSQCTRRFWDMVSVAQIERGKTIEMAAQKPTSSTRSPAKPVAPSSQAPRNPGDGVGAKEDKMAALKRERDMQETCKALFDLREGMRCAILGAAPPALGAPKVWPPRGARPMGTADEALKVYFTYREMLSMEGLDIVEALRAGDDEEMPGATSESFFHRPGNSDAQNEEFNLCASMAAEQPTTPQLRVLRESASRFECVPRISWWTVFLWAEQKEQLASSAVYKSAYAALQRGLARWRKAQATVRQQRQGVTVTSMFKWIWPSATHRHVADMLQHAVCFEMKKVRMAEPPVISKAERRAILGLFRSMDQNKQGTLRPVDLAGGDDPRDDMKRALQNCIDDETVRAALGNSNIDETRFLELMCPDGYRGHEDAEEVHLEDGRILVKHVRPSIGFEGWWLQEPLEEEQHHRRVIDVLEDEMLRYRHAAPEALHELGED